MSQVENKLWHVIGTEERRNENSYSIQIAPMKMKYSLMNELSLIQWKMYFLNKFCKKRQSILRNCTNCIYTDRYFNHLAPQNPVYTPSLCSTAQGQQHRHKKRSAMSDQRPSSPLVCLQQWQREMLFRDSTLWTFCGSFPLSTHSPCSIYNCLVQELEDNIPAYSF